MEISQRPKRLVANLTLKGLLARVDADVYNEIVLLGEATRAVVAGEGSLPGMAANVHLQLGRAFEGLIAFVAGLGHFRGGLRSPLLPLLRRFPLVPTRFAFTGVEGDLLFIVTGP